MIPLHIRISGFLSYRDPVELDFQSFELACISGQNGAGKSSLLDAMTWVLFGEARGKSTEVIHLNQDVKGAEVIFTFFYEGDTFRVQRTLPRGKGSVLEFQILDAGQNSGLATGRWKPLTEKSTRETQARIERVLRMDYETFINASFFLQGKADEFTQKKPGDRKAVLSSILGLEMWEVYRERTINRRKEIENEVSDINGRLAEIDLELNEEVERRARLDELEKNLERFSSARKAQEHALENLRRESTRIPDLRGQSETLLNKLEQTNDALKALEVRLSNKKADYEKYSSIIARAAQITADHENWQAVQKKLESLEALATNYQDILHQQEPLSRAIEIEKTKLEQEEQTLLRQQEEIQSLQADRQSLDENKKIAQSALKKAEEDIQRRAALEQERNAAREQQAELKGKNEALRKEMELLVKRIDTLEQAQGAICPVCRQEMNDAQRESTLQDLRQEGKSQGDLHRANQGEVSQLSLKITDWEKEIGNLAGVDQQRVQQTKTISQIDERLAMIEAKILEWQKNGQARLSEVREALRNESFSALERQTLSVLEQELSELGYDRAGHQATRQAESALRGVENEFNELKVANELRRHLEGEIAAFEQDKAQKRGELETLRQDYQAADERLMDAVKVQPQVQEAEKALRQVCEDENETRDRVGAARQKVNVLENQKARKAEYDSQRDGLNLQIAYHKTLERAFGKDGVPALLIEQALPQIEQKANDLLERLSDGHMSIRFVTQAEFKDKKRDDLKETLDIQISDSAGMRNYEMYSGGEAFRVNFAIRLALSEMLAQRKGARLQTLVIDEGFGSQDSSGRQRLIEAINTVKNDFAKILIITHLDELKDAFPNRIEIEKNERGSSIRVQ